MRESEEWEAALAQTETAAAAKVPTAAVSDTGAAAAAPLLSLATPHPANCSRSEADEWEAALTTKPLVAVLECGCVYTRS
jgi:hypothetical protein